MEVVEELGIQDKTIGVAPVGCSVFAYHYMNIDMQEAAHGRASAVATGIKRVLPDKYVFSYQGDGDLAAIGTAETIHTVNRGENILMVFINNGIYGMTGGQMAPTSLLGQVTTTSPYGRDVKMVGHPIRIADLLIQLPGAYYVTRQAVHNPNAVRKLKKALEKSFQYQKEGKGTCFVEVVRRLAERGVLGEGRAPDDPELWAREQELLEIFIDLLSLFRRRRGAPDEAEEHDDPRDARLSTSEYLLTYLRDIGGRGEGLPEPFLERLRRALAHHGMDSLEPTPELEEAPVRIYKAQHRIEDQVAPMLSVSQRKLDHVAALRGLADDRLRAAMDRLIAVTRGRFQALDDMAREVRHAFVERPVLDQVRVRLYAEAEEHLDYLSRNPEAPDRDQRIEALVSCPQPLKTFLSRRLPGAGAELQGLMLEVLVRRYYRLRRLEHLRCQAHDGDHFLMGEYDVPGGLPGDAPGARISLVAAHTVRARLAEVAATAAEIAAGLPAENDVAIDFFLLHEAELADADADAMREILARAGFSRPLRRVAVACSPHRGSLGMAEVQHFTFRPGEHGLEEDRRMRGLHPMMAQRLHLWRLEAFTLDRLPSVEDVYLFRAVARDNPQDERLLALAEVRDLTPVHDEGGRVVALPHLEGMLMEALDALRRVQAQRPPQRRLFWNRVQLFVWPPLLLEPEALRDLVHRLAPATEGLGIERVLIEARMPSRRTGELEAQMIDISSAAGQGVVIGFREPPATPMKPLDPYTQKVVRLRQRGLLYPYEIIAMLTPARDVVQSALPFTT